MTRNLKVLSLALVAVFAMSALVASGAQAAKFKAGNGTGTATITAEAHPGSPAQIFETDVGPVECQEVSGMYSGAAEAETATFTEIEYSGECNTAGLESEVNFNGCDYVFHASGSADVSGANCEAEPVEVVAAGGLCVVTVGPQSGLGPIKYTNVQTSGKKEEITLHAEVGNISYSWAGPLCGEGSNTNGVYTGTVTARAETTAPGLQPLDLTVV